VDQLLKVRVGTVNLKNKIVELNHEIQQSASKIVDKVRELITLASIFNLDIFKK